MSRASLLTASGLSCCRRTCRWKPHALLPICRKHAAPPPRWRTLPHVWVSTPSRVLLCEQQISDISLTERKEEKMLVDRLTFIGSTQDSKTSIQILEDEPECFSTWPRAGISSISHQIQPDPLDQTEVWLVWHSHPHIWIQFRLGHVLLRLRIVTADIQSRMTRRRPTLRSHQLLPPWTSWRRDELQSWNLITWSQTENVSQTSSEFP